MVASVKPLHQGFIAYQFYLWVEPFGPGIVSPADPCVPDIPCASHSPNFSIILEYERIGKRFWLAVIMT